MPKKDLTNQKNQKNQNGRKPGASQNTQQKPKEQKPALTAEQRKEKERNDYIAELDRMAEKVKNPYSQLQAVYGGNGKMPEGMKGKGTYDTLQITAPEGMSDLFPMAVTLGAMMDPSRLDRRMTDSGFILGSSTYIDFNRTFFLESIPAGDKRHGEFPQLMITAREEAVQAMNDLTSKRSDEQAYNYLNQFIQYAVRNVTDLVHYSSSNMFNEKNYIGPKLAIRIAADLISTEPYSSHITISEYDRMKIMALANQERVREEIYAEKSKLMKDPPAAGSTERENAIAELMFKEYLIGTLTNERSGKDRADEAIFQSIMDGHGVDMSTREYSKLYGTPQNVSAIRGPFMRNSEKNRTTDREVILSRPDGIETLRKMYMESIRNTQTFKDLVAAEGTDLQDKLMELDQTASKGFGSFKEIRTNGEAEPFHQQKKEEYDRSNKATSELIGEMLDRYALARYSVWEYDAKNMDRNHERIEELYDEFSGNATLLPEDKTLQSIVKDLNDLKDQARSMAKSGKASRENLSAYTGTIDKIQQDIDGFFREHGRSPEPKQEPLYLNLRRLSRNLKWNKRGIMEPERRKERDTVIRQNRDIYEKPTNAGIDALLRIRKEQLEDESRGETAGRKELLGKAMTATGKLADLIRSGKKLEKNTKEEALGYLRDILAERVYTKAIPVMGTKAIHFPERYATAVVDKLPEFKALSGKLTMMDIGRIAFQGQADQMLKKYTADQMTNLFGREMDLESKAVSARIAREGEGRTKERLKREERENYRKDAELRKQDQLNSFRLLHRYYGSKPDMHPSIRLHNEYNALRIDDLPKDLDENTVTAIVLGAIMKKERMERPMTSSSFRGGTSTYLEFNRNYLIDSLAKDVPDSERQGNFPLALVEGRREALEAIEEYKNGHPEKARALIEEFIDVASDAGLQSTPPTSSNLMGSPKNNTQTAFHQLGAEMEGKPPFFAKGRIPEGRRIHLAANDQTLKAMNRVYERKPDILTRPKPAGSNDRIREIEDLLFDQYLMSTLKKAHSQKGEASKPWNDRMFEKYGLDENYDPDAYSDMNDHIVGGEVGTQQMWNYRENLVTDHEWMMSTGEGVQKLKELYLPLIRKTKLYQNLISAKGDEYETLLHDSEKETSNGLQQFKGVKLPEGAKEINNRLRPELDKRSRELEAQLDELAVANVRDMQTFNGYDKASMQNNAQHLSYLSNLIKWDVLSAKSLPSPTKTVIGNMRQAVNTFVKYANTLSKRKDPINSSDMLLYNEYAKKITTLADGFVAGSPVPGDELEKSVYLAIRRVGFMAKVNADLVTYPAKVEDRKYSMQNSMSDRDPERVAAYTAKHPKPNVRSADYRYAVLSDKALKDLNHAMQETLSDSMRGARSSRRKMIRRSKEATLALTRMIKAGEDHISQNQDKARELLKDIFAERIMAKFDRNKVMVQEGEKTLGQVGTEIPEFKEGTKTITIGTIGEFLFENRSDKILEKYTQQELNKRQEIIANRKRNEDLKKIQEMEAAAEKKKKEKKDEIIDDPENKNEIIDHSEEKNEIIDDPENRNEIRLDPEDEMTKDSVRDHKMKKQVPDAPDAPPVPGKKKSKKGTPARGLDDVEPKKEEPKVEEPKEEYDSIKVFSDLIYKEPPKEEPPKPVIPPKDKEKPKDEAKPKDEEKPKDEVKPKIEEDQNSVSSSESGFSQLKEQYGISKKGRRQNHEKNIIHLINDDSLLGEKEFLPDRKLNLKQDLKSAEKGPNRADAEAFIKDVSLFSETRQLVVKAIQADRLRINNLRASSNTRSFITAMDNCLTMLVGNARYDAMTNTPARMWDAVYQLAGLAQHLKPDMALRYKVMASILGEAVKPLSSLKQNFPPLKTKNGADVSMNKLLLATAEAEDTYHVIPPKAGVIRNEYRSLEAKAKAKYILQSKLAKASGLEINHSPVNHDPDEGIIELHHPQNVHEAAKRCVTKFFLATAEKPDADMTTLNGLIAVVDNNGYKAQIEELEKNPVFRKVVERHPNHYYSNWQKIVDRAALNKQRAVSDIDQMTNEGGLNGLAGYVAFGNHGDNLLIMNNGREEQNKQKVRLAQVLSAKLLADGTMTTLRQAIGTGMIKQQDVAMETLAYIERKNIRILDNNGRINQNFRQKLLNGSFQKDMIKTQAKFLEQVRKRDPEQKRVLQNKLNTVKRPAPQFRV